MLLCLSLWIGGLNIENRGHHHVRLQEGRKQRVNK